MTILNKLKDGHNGRTKVRFTQGNFTSPVLGNVWEGREAELPHSTAAAFIGQGYAVDITHDKPSDNPAALKEPKTPAAPAAVATGKPAETKKQKDARLKREKRASKKAAKTAAKPQA